LIATGCGRDEGARANPAAPPPSEVGVVTIQPHSVTLTRELPGRTSPIRVAEVRARVNGIVLERLFQEGTDVKEGQPLFRIDAAPYQAQLESARAQIARAEATLASAKSLSERYEKLLQTNAVSKQEYDDAVAKAKGAQADLAAARAATKSASINVEYTEVKAPIAGRIGRSEVTEGAYVQSGQATLLATIQQIDKMYVDLTWSAPDLLKLRRSLETGQLQGPKEAKVTLLFEDGREYDQTGALQFADVTVDQTTGSISLRAIVPNPKGELLPGMFVRARIEEGVRNDALLVPQRAVTRDQQGNPVALVVGKDGKVERRQLATDRAVGDNWLITKGLAAGDQVVIEGIQKARPGSVVKAVPAQQQQSAQPQPPAQAQPSSPQQAPKQARP
jgi:membrane fusion protein (multidrug efflux system)